MPIAAQCSQCGVRLRIADDKAGKMVRCPKCGQVFRVPAAEERYAGFEVVDEPPSVAPVEEKRSVPTAPQDSESSSSSASSARRTKKHRKRTGIQVNWTVVISVILAVFGASVGIYLLFVFLGLAGTASTAFAELADILENAASALENARHPQQRSEAAKQLDEQAGRLSRWVNTYRDKQEQQVVIEAAQRRYGERIQKAAQRSGVALQQLRQDQAAMKDPQLQAAVANWERALGNLGAAADPLAKFRNPRMR
mgnify:CR=1 FL=1